MRLPHWFPGVRTSRAHTAAWTPELLRGADGLTEFARRTEAIVTVHLEVLGAQVVSRTLHTAPGPESPDRESWIELRIDQPPLVVWVYDDQWEIIGSGINATCEHWDAATPEASRQLASGKLEQAISGLAGQLRSS